MADDDSVKRERAVDALSGMGGGQDAAPPRGTPAKAPRPARPDRPSVPTSADWESGAGSTSAAQPTTADYLGAVSDVDDDAVIAPAPEPEALTHVSAASPARSQRDPRRMPVQRTLIPILLTLGTLLTITGALRWIAGEDSSVGGLGASLSLSLLLGGVLVLAVGIMNVLYVRAMLAAHMSTTKRQ